MTPSNGWVEKVGWESQSPVYECVRESVDQVYVINNRIQTHSCCAHRFRTNIVEH